MSRFSTRLSEIFRNSKFFLLHQNRSYDLPFHIYRLLKVCTLVMKLNEEYNANIAELPKTYVMNIEDFTNPQQQFRQNI